MENFDFNLKAHIHGSDGKLGQLAGLVIDPEIRRVTDLIVKQGYLMPQQRVVPIETVQSAAQDDVHLYISSNDLDGYPEYRLVEYEEPITGLGQKITEVPAPYGLYGASEPTVPTRKKIIREGIVFDQKMIESDMPVKNLEGKIGKAMRLVMNPERNEIVCLVVQQGIIFHELLVVPISLVENVAEDEILINGANETAENLMRYNDLVGTNLLTK